MSGSIPIDPKEGVNPQLALCPICGEPNNEVLLVGRSTVWRHTCGRITIAYTGRGPTLINFACEGCHRPETHRNEWSSDGQYDKAKHGPLLGRSPCTRCEGWLKNACIVKCSTCRRMYEFTGAYRAIKAHDPTEYEGANHELDHERGVALGLLEKIVGRVIQTDHCQLCQDEKATAAPEQPHDG